MEPSVKSKAQSRRLPGRPARLSSETIIQSSLKLLETHPLDDVTMAAVAESMGASTMSLYKYFPNRDALLEAVSAHCFDLFEPPTPNPDWRAYLLAWLWELQAHFDRYPVVQKMTGWQGRIPAAWLRVVMPIVRLLQEQGLEGSALALATEYFLSTTLGLMDIENAAATYRPKLPLQAMDQLPTEDQALLLELQPSRKKVLRDDVLEYGFRRIIEGLEPLLPKTARHPRS
jgi:TetR/AcrR family transcriptional regulator, tetracycline repressor protein